MTSDTRYKVVKDVPLEDSEFLSSYCDLVKKYPEIERYQTSVWSEGTVNHYADSDGEYVPVIDYVFDAWGDPAIKGPYWGYYTVPYAATSTTLYLITGSITVGLVAPAIIPPFLINSFRTDQTTVVWEKGQYIVEAKVYRFNKPHDGWYLKRWEWRPKSPNQGIDWDNCDVAS